MFDFWSVQSEKLLFPEIAWSKPEQKSRAGKLLIIGGGAGNFRGLSLAYETALKTGAGQVKVLAPNSLRKNLKIENLTDVIFAPSNNSGGFSNDAWADFLTGENWADAILFIGDTNRNSETAILFEKFILKTEKPVMISRDAVDILMNSFAEILEKENVAAVASFSQLQKIFTSVFYPKVLTFSTPLANFADILHKFTLTFPAEIITFHAENLIFAQNGKILSTPISAEISRGKISPLKIWTGEIPTKITVFQMWNPSKKIESAITAVAD